MGFPKKIGPFKVIELVTILPAAIILIGMGVYSALVKKAAGPAFFTIIIGLTALTMLGLKVVPRRRQWILLMVWTALAVMLILLLKTL